ncbi:MAG: hypothetical protein ACRCX8_20825 [Sarcina sp.]
MHYLTWTKEMEDQLREVYDKLPIKKVVRMFGGTELGIRAKASRLGITRKIKKYTKENKEDMLRLKRIGLSYPSIAEIYETSGGAVYRIVKQQEKIK